MTPLAYRIMKDISGGAARSDDALCELLAPFREEFHCFEVTAVVHLPPTLEQQIYTPLLPSVPRPVLPPVRTLIDWSAPAEKTPRRPLRAVFTLSGAAFRHISP